MGNLHKSVRIASAILFTKTSKLPLTRSQSFRRIMRVRVDRLALALEDQTSQLLSLSFALTLVSKIESRPIFLTSPCSNYPTSLVIPIFFQ